jgi:hypothetical protein
MNTLYFFTALQPFVFGMRYLYSATKFALSKPCASLKCIYYTTITVVVLYSGVLIAILLVICLTFPGWDSVLKDFDRYLDWKSNVFDPCFIA